MLLLSTDRRADETLQRNHLEQVDLLAGGYNRDLQARVRRLHRETARALHEIGARRSDAEEDPLAITEAQRAQLLLTLGKVVKVWRAEQKPDQGNLHHLFGRADRVTTTSARRSVAQVVRGRGVEKLLLDLPVADPRRMRQDFIRSNVELISSIDSRYFADIALQVDRAFKEGRSWGWVADGLEERYGVSSSRAQLIARDQLGKLTGQLTQVRNLELGLDSYQWMTSRDERVRRTHERMEGRIILWSEPPEMGHPGSDFQCRCTSRAVIDAAHAKALREMADQRMAQTSAELARSPIVLGEIVPIPSRRITPGRIAEFRGQFRRVA